VVTYKEGCGDIACKNESFIFPAVKAAKRADATVILAGLDLSVEAEGLDRTDLVLPGYQTQLITQVAEVAQGPVVLVILSAGGVDISFAKENPNIGGNLWAGYPGEEGAELSRMLSSATIIPVNRKLFYHIFSFLVCS